MGFRPPCGGGQGETLPCLLQELNCTFKIAPNLRTCGPRLVLLDSYRPGDAIAVRTGDARESAIVAQLVPAAEIH